MNILLLIIVTFWSVVIFKGILFWLYLWQKKEYRYDRLRAHFELFSSRKILLNKRNLTLISLFLISFVPINFFSILVTLAILLFYGFFSFRAVSQLQNHTLKLPRFTPRVLLALLASIISYVYLTVIFIYYASSHFLKWLLLGDLFVPVIITLAIFYFYPLASILRKRTFKKAALKRKKMKDLLVIGITGSYGKTTMKEILYDILSREYRVLKTPQNTNTEMGVAQIVLNKLNNKYDIFIVEMGAYKKGEIAKIAQIVKPHIGILTGINQQHLSLFGSLQNIQEAKYELIESLPEKGLAIFNGDNENTKALFRQSKKVKRLYGSDPFAQPGEQTITIESIKHTNRGMEIDIREGKITETLKTSLLGRHNASNLTGAITIARSLQMEYDSIKKAIRDIKAPQHTLQIKRGIKESTVIDDSYSANVHGVFAALEILHRMQAKQRLCILEPLIELGPTAKKVHKDIGAKIAESCDWCIITSKDYFSEIYREALEGGMSKNNIFCLPSPEAALRKAQELIDKDDVVLLENRIPVEILNGLVLRTKEREK